MITKLKKLSDDFDLRCLLDKWCFYTLKDFIEQLECKGITDNDGYGEFVYIDKDFNLYKDTYTDVIEACNCYDFFTIEKLQEEFSTEEYKVFGVFWFNK